MVEIETKALKAKEKRAVPVPAERTKPGPTFTPAVDIFETDREITLVADIPGVKADNLDIDLRDNILTLAGEVEAPEGQGEVEVLREYDTGKYLREFTLSEMIDQSKIEADLKDGVLRLRLPKVEAVSPRKVTVKVE
ncbi:MAG: Hsp20/alpha crystallin family protein [Deltaproteobacteria bacterium]|nr:MAG: Hsp20/alpha crystallin family protein [Deltaproteobacteria bacterium]